MVWFNKRCCTKHDDYKIIPDSESEPLIIGMDEKIKRRRSRRRLCHWLFAAVALILVGHGVFAYMYCRSHVECVPYEGGTTTVELPINYRGSAVLLHSSIASHDVFVTRVEKETNLVKVTFEEEEKTERAAELRVCTLKGGKITGVGVFAPKNAQDSLPVIKSVKVEVPVGVPPPSIDLLPPPRRRCSSITGFLKWVGVWDSKGTNAAKLQAAAEYN
ncbi:hypothetical protein CTheo_2703 [Ceratobasidium theobromae]|uniref:Transmembrane protein n=1 Tax=Ceratobasidium theobromae TaxID=1582974 RepID=A0A5N5QQL7_9AGAM|nr:hypothetical protein CTheo_2703 [Ceratobasidium theobromae]